MALLRDVLNVVQGLSAEAYVRSEVVPGSLTDGNSRKSFSRLRLILMFRVGVYVSRYVVTCSWCLLVPKEMWR